MDGCERLVRQFLAHIDVERGLSKATVCAYGSDLHKYVSWLHEQGIHDLDRLASIHAFHRFALSEHVVHDDVASQVKAPKGASTLPDVLSVDEVMRLMDSIPLSRHHDGKQGHGDAAADDPVMLRDKALLEFMYATGSRKHAALIWTTLIWTIRWRV